MQRNILVVEDKLQELALLEAQIKHLAHIHWLPAQYLVKDYLEEFPNKFDLVLIDFLGTSRNGQSELKEITHKEVYITSTINPRHLNLPFPFIEKDKIKQFLENKYGKP